MKRWFDGKRHIALLSVFALVLFALTLPVRAERYCHEECTQQGAHQRQTCHQECHDE